MYVERGENGAERGVRVLGIGLGLEPPHGGRRTGELFERGARVHAQRERVVADNEEHTPDQLVGHKRIQQRVHRAGVPRVLDGRPDLFSSSALRAADPEELRRWSRLGCDVKVMREKRVRRLAEPGGVILVDGQERRLNAGRRFGRRRIDVIENDAPTRELVFPRRKHGGRLLERLEHSLSVVRLRALESKHPEAALLERERATLHLHDCYDAPSHVGDEIALQALELA